MLAVSCYFTPSVEANEAVKTLPSEAFLEFLAEMQKVDGKWVSPVDLEDKNAQPVANKTPPKELAKQPNAAAKAAVKAKAASGTQAEVKQ